MSKFDDLFSIVYREKLEKMPLLKSKNPLDPMGAAFIEPNGNQIPGEKNALLIDELFSVSVDNSGNLLKLKEQFRRIPPIPYIGAGLSLIPSWGGLLSKIADWMSINSEEFVNAMQQKNFERAAQSLYETAPGLFYQALEDVLSPRRLSANGDNLSPSLKIIPYLCNGVLITTNFDRCIERAYERYDSYMAPGVLSVSQLGVELPTMEVSILRHRIQEDEHFLLKLHGDAHSGLDSLVFTREQYDLYYGVEGGRNINNKPMRRVLREVLLTRPLLFIGCSLDKDRSMDVLLEEAAKQNIKDIRGYSFAIVQKTEDDQKFQEKRRFLSDMRIRPIWYPEGQHAYIAAILNDILVDKQLQHVQRNDWFGRIQKGINPDVDIDW
jgi:hypothetical protein